MWCRRHITYRVQFFSHLSDEKQGNFTADARKEENASFGLQEQNVKGRLVDVDDDNDDDDHLRRGETVTREEGVKDEEKVEIGEIN